MVATSPTPSGKACVNARRRPKLQAMKDWLERTRDTVADGGSLARAKDDSLKRWPALSRYARSAILPIDNNPVEHIIRPIALGKKNGLFTARRALTTWPHGTRGLPGAARCIAILL